MDCGAIIHTFGHQNERYGKCFLLPLNAMTSRSLNILVAEDKTSVAESLALMLRYEGHHVVTVLDGIHALTALVSAPGKFSVLITDNNMPKMSGVELVQKLHELRNPVKVIVLSAHLSPALDQCYRALGVRHIVDKPFDFSPLRLAIAEISDAICGKPNQCGGKSGLNGLADPFKF